MLSWKWKSEAGKEEELGGGPVVVLEGRNYAVASMRKSGKRIESRGLSMRSEELGLIQGLFNQAANCCQVLLQAAHEDVIVVGPGNRQENLVSGRAGFI